MWPMAIMLTSAALEKFLQNFSYTYSKKRKCFYNWKKYTHSKFGAKRALKHY